MCAILDANYFHKFRDPNNDDLEPVRKWLRNGYGRIVYSDSEKNKKEWKKGGMERWIKERSRAGQFRLISKGVREKANELKDIIKSDDPHIIALALIAKVKVLVFDDNKLIQDFKEHVSQAKVHRTKSHKHLLRKDTCP